MIAALSAGQIAESTSGLKAGEPGAAAALPREFLRQAVFVLLGAPDAAVSAST